METKRKTISPKIRFEVFKRDLFTCQYCGRKPPDAILEVDHIVAVKHEGTNNIDNLICSCFDCNRGKSDIKLETIPDTISNKLEILEERKKQYNEYIEMLKFMSTKTENEIDMVEKEFMHRFTKTNFKKDFREYSVKKFINELGVEEVINAMNISCEKIKQKTNVLKYFSGICWNKIREK